MKLYKTTVQPLSRFGTPLQGDTLFGQLCWAIRFLEGEARLTKLLENYHTAPFVVVSDGFVCGYLPKPKMPSSLLGESPEDKKENRKKIWLTPEALQQGDFTNAKRNDEVGIVEETIQTMHNSLNYKTFMTSSDGKFAPFGETEFQTGDRDVYVLIDESQADKSSIERALRHIGRYGYGKNASTGKGRFEITPFEATHWRQEGKRWMALSAFSAQGIEATLYAEPFTRFGKAGANRAYKQPFKKPVLLAACGSVVVYDTQQDHSYIGKAIQGISDLYEDILHQGYAITIALGEAI